MGSSRQNRQNPAYITRRACKRRYTKFLYEKSTLHLQSAF